MRSMGSIELKIDFGLGSGSGSAKTWRKKIPVIWMVEFVEALKAQVGERCGSTVH